MAKFFDWDGDDDKFVESMLVPARRKAMIRQLSRRRKRESRFLVAMTLILIINTFLVIFLEAGIEDFSIFFVLWIIPAMSYGLLDYRLKMLKTFDRIESLPKTDGE